MVMKRLSSLRILSLPGPEFAPNPYIKILCKSLERSGMSIVRFRAPDAKFFKFDIIHMHWPDFYITTRPLYSAMLLGPSIIIYLIITKLIRKKVVWTVHDVMPMRVRHPRLLR